MNVFRANAIAYNNGVFGQRYPDSRFLVRSTGHRVRLATILMKRTA